MHLTRLGTARRTLEVFEGNEQHHAWPLKHQAERVGGASYQSFLSMARRPEDSSSTLAPGLQRLRGEKELWLKELTLT